MKCFVYGPRSHIHSKKLGCWFLISLTTLMLCNALAYYNANEVFWIGSLAFRVFLPLWCLFKSFFYRRFTWKGSNGFWWKNEEELSDYSETILRNSYDHSYAKDYLLSAWTFILKLVLVWEAIFVNHTSLQMFY